MRLRSDIWVSALLRRADHAGRFGAVLRRGSSEAGAIFIQILRRDGSIDLYAPAPQAVYDPDVSDRGKDERLFTVALRACTEADVRNHYEREARFDPDFWAVELEDEVSVDLFDIVD